MASTHHPGNPLSPADTYVPPFDPPPGGFGTPMTASKEPPRVNITKEVLSAFKGMGPSKIPAYQHATGGKIPVQIRHQHFAPTGLHGSMPQYGHINGGGISILNSGGTNPLPSTIEGSSKYFQGSRHAEILEYYRKGEDLQLTQAVNQTRIHHSSHSAFLNKLDKDAMKNFKLVKCEYKPNQCPYKWSLRVLEQASHLPGARSLTHYFHELVRRNPLNLDPPDAILQAGEAETIDIVTASTAQMNDVMKLHQAALRHTTQQVPAASADAPDLTHPSSWPPMSPVETLRTHALKSQSSSRTVVAFAGSSIKQRALADTGAEATTLPKLTRVLLCRTEPPNPRRRSKVRRKEQRRSRNHRRRNQSAGIRHSSKAAAGIQSATK